MFIFKIIVRWIVLSAAVVLAEYVVPGIHLSGTVWITALAVGLVLGLINAFVKPVLSILTLPINLLTFGIFSLVINALFFWGVAYVVTGFSVANFVVAFWGSLIVSIINWVAGLLVE